MRKVVLYALWALLLPWSIASADMSPMSVDLTSGEGELLTFGSWNYGDVGITGSFEDFRYRYGTTRPTWLIAFEVDPDVKPDDFYDITFADGLTGNLTVLNTRFPLLNELATRDAHSYALFTLCGYSSQPWVEFSIDREWGWGDVGALGCLGGAVNSGLTWCDQDYALNHVPCPVGDIVPVPVPGGVVLGSIGLSFVGWLRRRDLGRPSV